MRILELLQDGKYHWYTARYDFTPDGGVVLRSVTLDGKEIPLEYAMEIEFGEVPRDAKHYNLEETMKFADTNADLLLISRKPRDDEDAEDFPLDSDEDFDTPFEEDEENWDFEEDEEDDWEDGDPTDYDLDDEEAE